MRPGATISPESDRGRDNRDAQHGLHRRAQGPIVGHERRDDHEDQQTLGEQERVQDHETQCGPLSRLAIPPMTKRIAKAQMARRGRIELPRARCRASAMGNSRARLNSSRRFTAIHSSDGEEQTQGDRLQNAGTEQEKRNPLRKSEHQDHDHEHENQRRRERPRQQEHRLRPRTDRATTISATLRRLKETTAAADSVFPSDLLPPFSRMKADYRGFRRGPCRAREGGGLATGPARTAAPCSGMAARGGRGAGRCVPRMSRIPGFRDHRGPAGWVRPPCTAHLAIPSRHLPAPGEGGPVPR